MVEYASCYVARPTSKRSASRKWTAQFIDQVGRGIRALCEHYTRRTTCTSSENECKNVSNDLQHGSESNVLTAFVATLDCSRFVLFVLRCAGDSVTLARVVGEAWFDGV